MTKTPAKRALRLLRDLTICRLRGDGYQHGLVEMALDEFDLERGYMRRVRPEDNKPLQHGQRMRGTWK